MRGVPLRMGPTGGPAASSDSVEACTDRAGIARLVGERRGERRRVRCVRSVPVVQAPLGSAGPRWEREVDRGSSWGF